MCILPARFAHIQIRTLEPFEIACHNSVDLRMNKAPDFHGRSHRSLLPQHRHKKMGRGFPAHLPVYPHKILPEQLIEFLSVLCGMLVTVHQFQSLPSATYSAFHAESIALPGFID